MGDVSRRVLLQYEDGMEKSGFYYVDNFWRYGHRIPTVAGLANILGVSSYTLKKWAHSGYHRFDEVFYRIRDKQELLLINMGINNTISSGTLRTLLFYRNAAALPAENSESESGVTIQIKDFKDDSEHQNNVIDAEYAELAPALEAKLIGHGTDDDDDD